MALRADPGLADGTPLGYGKPRRLAGLESGRHEEHVRVRRADLDMNGHVNHVFYIAQAEQAVPGELRDGAQVTSFEIEFKSECHDGDEIVVGSQGMDGAAPIFLHSLVRQGDGRAKSRAPERLGPFSARLRRGGTPCKT